MPNVCIRLIKAYPIPAVMWLPKANRYGTLAASWVMAASPSVILSMTDLAVSFYCSHVN